MNVHRVGRGSPCLTFGTDCAYGGPVLKKARRFISDAWESIIQVGMGSGANSAPANWQYTAPPTLTPAQLDTLYDGNWLVKKTVDGYPKIALKDGLPAPKDVLEAYRAVGVGPRFADGVILRAACLGRLQGGCVVLAGFKGLASTAPIEPGAPPREVLWLDVVPRADLTPEGDEGNAALPSYGTPVLWKVSGQHPRKDYVFHISQAAVFEGDAPSPTSLKATHSNFWTSSVIQAVYEDLLRIGQRNAAVDRVMSRVSIGALRVSGLLDAVTAEADSDLDLKLQALAKGIEKTNLILLGEGEDYVVHSATLTGLAEPVLSAIEIYAGASGYPMTELIGRSPAGMNATGESDRAMLYDKVDSWRRTKLQSPAEQVLSWCAGKPVVLDWKPLFSPTGKEAAEIINMHLEAVAKVNDIAKLNGEALVKAVNAQGALPFKLEYDKEADEEPEVPLIGADPDGAEADNPGPESNEQDPEGLPPPS
jgi:phage-related protein (TIGR01555 family)